MASRICDLPGELVGEILSKVPATSLRAIRSTCKKWNLLSRNQAFGKGKSTGKQFMSFMMKDFKVCSMKFDLDLMEPSIKQVAILDQFEISKIYHCDGLLLCVVKDNTGFVVWNPYLGQTKWIPPRNNYCYDTPVGFALGYDNNRNHKILKICPCGFEIYDFSSHSWRYNYYLPPSWHKSCRGGVSLKGNAYFLCGEVISVGEGNAYSLVRDLISVGEGGKTMTQQFLVCFDFTTESFGLPLSLPLPVKFRSCLSLVLNLSCVRDEQLVVLHYHLGGVGALEVWVTDKIGPNVVSWSKFFRLSRDICFYPGAGSFFIDEEKKVVVVFDLVLPFNQSAYQKVHIHGQDRFFDSVYIGEAPNFAMADTPPETYAYDLDYAPEIYCPPLVCSSSYVPSLVQLPVNQSRKRKQRYV